MSSCVGDGAAMAASSCAAEADDAAAALAGRSAAVVLAVSLPPSTQPRLPFGPWPLPAGINRADGAGTMGSSSRRGRSSSRSSSSSEEPPEALVAALPPPTPTRPPVVAGLRTLRHTLSFPLGFACSCGGALGACCFPRCMRLAKPASCFSLVAPERDCLAATGRAWASPSTGRLLPFGSAKCHWMVPRSGSGSFFAGCCCFGGRCLGDSAAEAPALSNGDPFRFPFVEAERSMPSQRTTGRREKRPVAVSHWTSFV